MVNNLKSMTKELTLSLVIQPKASRNEIVGLLGNEIKIALTAPPVDGKANDHLKKYLSKICKTPQSNIEILKGLTNKHKTVLIKEIREIPKELQIELEKLSK